MSTNYRNSFYQPLKNFSYTVMIGLALMAVCSGLSFIVGIGQVMDSKRTMGIEGLESTPIWMLVQGLVSLVEIPIYILTIIFFLIWLNRANKNLTPLRASYIEFSSGWAVGWWFIPFANLVKPFQVVREVWRESDPDVQPDSGFLSSVGAPTPAFMGFWWGCWITSNIASNIAGRLYDPDNFRTSEASGLAFIVAGVFAAAAAALAIMVVKDITKRQEERFARIGTFQPDEPPPPPTFTGAG